MAMASETPEALARILTSTEGWTEFLEPHLRRKYLHLVTASQARLLAGSAEEARLLAVKAQEVEEILMFVLQAATGVEHRINLMPEVDRVRKSPIDRVAYAIGRS